MKYYFNKVLEASFDEAIARVTEALRFEGFGILTDIDVQKTLKMKLGVEFRQYRILGACHPQSAYAALEAESRIGAMLPCNVIVQELEEGKTEVSAIDPIASMLAIENPSLGEIAKEVQEKLRTAIAKL